ncbi:NADH:flavin oxidoreductase/NADH oxidase [Hanseniaspora valbyensis NRRL Y-1626]|uniref:NADH:flavin oxidoreductase/NADH oxidase n=1 Tax=Hanseniaspora valbyensis NRRL Y-1626 TaxID=766949 RepID=A0A1B7TBW4_9ASCO|nr:NADH:flavin oxidoreductase/NADH oxidase [Hanseniaspora valbyensis NRRL Y-1626]
MSDERYTPVGLGATNFFKPLKLSDKITLGHRGVVAPVTRMRADENHVLRQTTDYTETDDWKKFISDPANKTGEKKRGLAEEYYYQRSQKKGTLIITEGTFISAQAGGCDFVPGIYSEEQVESLTKIASAIHENESYVFVQLWNLGRAAFPNVLKRDGFPYLTSSAECLNDGDEELAKQQALEPSNPLRSATIDEIEQFKKDYINAARNSFKAGADGVEIHSANGYFLNQFLDKKANKRQDKYGSQNYENRSRLLLEVFDSLSAEFGADRVSLRLSPYGTFNSMSGSDDIQETDAFYSYLYDQFEKRRLAGNGPVYISLVEPRVANLLLNEGEGEVEGASNDYIFEHFKGTVVRAGNMALGNQFTKQIVQQNDRTLIAFGRYFIANPDLIDRLENDWSVNKYDRGTFYTPTFKGYTDYPYYKKD